MGTIIMEGAAMSLESKARCLQPDLQFSRAFACIAQNVV